VDFNLAKWRNWTFGVASMAMAVSIAAAASVITVTGGCRLPGQTGPVPESLAASRQLTMQGNAALDQGHPSQALKHLAEAVEICPLDPDARRGYGEALWHEGRHEQAVAQMAEAARLTPDDAPLRVRLAEMHLAIGREDRAMEAAEAALDCNPKLASAWTIRAQLIATAGKPRQALADYQRALSYAPEDREVMTAIAELYRRLNQPAQALAMLNTLAETYPPGEEPAEVTRLQGMAYLALGRFEDAAEAYRTSLAGQRPTADLLCQLAEAEALCGRRDQAESAARQALALQPSHQPSRHLLENLRVASAPRQPGRQDRR